MISSNKSPLSSKDLHAFIISFISFSVRVTTESIIDEIPFLTIFLPIILSSASRKIYLFNF